MSTGDVKPQLITALTGMGREGRLEFFKKHHIAFAKHRAKNFDKHANYFLGRIQKQLDARQQSSTFSKPIENWSYNHTKPKDGIAKNFDEFSQIISSREKLNGHLESVKTLSSTINTQLNMLLQAIGDLALKNTTLLAAGKLNKEAERPLISINVENIEQKLFVPFKESLTHSIKELNKLDTQDLTTTDKEKLQNAIDAAKTKAKESISNSLKRAEQSIKDLGGNEFDPNNPNKKYIDLINQVKGLLFQARALIAIQGEPNFDELSKVVEVWAKEKIGLFSQTYKDHDDSTILEELRSKADQLAQNKETLLQAIPQQAENKSAITALINNTLHAQQITDIAKLDNTKRLAALNKLLTEQKIITEPNKSESQKTESPTDYSQIALQQQE